MRTGTAPFLTETRSWGDIKLPQLGSNLPHSCLGLPESQDPRCAWSRPAVTGDLSSVISLRAPLGPSVQLPCGLQRRLVILGEPPTGPTQQQHRSAEPWTQPVLLHQHTDRSCGASARPSLCPSLPSPSTCCWLLGAGRQGLRYLQALDEFSTNLCSFLCPSRNTKEYGEIRGHTSLLFPW